MVRSTLALAAVLSVASISLARDLVTLPVFVGNSTDATCKLLNITSAAIPAQLQLIISGGTVLADSGPKMVAAGEVAAISSHDPGKMLYCRFVKASKSKVRADLTEFTPGPGDLTDTLVVGAQ